jgi:hypothetical protein
MSKVSHVIFLSAIEIIKFRHHQLKYFISLPVYIAFILNIVLRALILKLRFIVTRLGCHVCDPG